MFGGIIGFATDQKLFTAATWLYVLHSNVHTLLNVTTIHLLEELYTNSALGHVPNAAGFAMIVFVRHTLQWIRKIMDVSRCTETLMIEKYHCLATTA